MTDDHPQADEDPSRPAARAGDHARRLALAAVVVASATAMSRVVGLAREVLIAGAYGVDPAYNVFVSVSAVPNVVQQLFADAAIGAALVPVLVALVTAGDVARARRVTGSLLGFMLLVVGAVVLLIVAAAPDIVRWLYPELTTTAATATEAARYLRIVAPTILVLSLAGVLSGVLVARERFTMPAVVSTVWNLVIITFVAVWNSSWGVDALAVGVLCGTVAELVLLALAVRAVHEPLSLNFHFRDSQMRRVLALMLPIAITLGILNFNALIDLYFAQFVGREAAAELHFAFRLYTLPQGIFAVTIGTVLFPSLSRFAAQHDMTRFRETLSTGIRQTIFVSLPFLAWFTVLAVPVVRVVFQRQAFSAADTAAVAPVLAAFALGLTFANVNMLFNRSFQSMQRPWLPLYVGLANLALNAVLDWILLRWLGTPGIALSTSLVSIFNTAALAYLLRARVGGSEARRLVVSIGKMALSAGAAGAVAAGLWRVLESFAAGGFVAALLVLLLTVAASAGVYAGATRLLRVEELGLVWRTLRRRRGRRVVGDGRDG